MDESTDPVFDPTHEPTAEEARQDVRQDTRQDTRQDVRQDERQDKRIADLADELRLEQEVHDVAQGAEDDRQDARQDERQDLRREHHVDQVTRSAVLARRAMWVFGVANILALVLGGQALRKVYDDEHKANDERYRNVLNTCLSDSQQNQVIIDFIAFANKGLAPAKLLDTQARNVFPVRSPMQCIQSANGKVTK